MKIKWLGHASFLITSRSGTRIITDPYQSGLKKRLVGLRYGNIQEPADVVTVSHNHWDHNNSAGVPGNPHVVRVAGTTQVDGIAFRGISGSHGPLRGPNIVFCFTVDGLRVCHLGDQAKPFTKQQFDEIGELDVLFLPIIRMPFMNLLDRRPTELELLAERTNVKVMIPMHFRSWKCLLPLLTIDGYLKNKGLEDKVESIKLEDCEVELTRETLPARPKFLILKPA